MAKNNALQTNLLNREVQVPNEADSENPLVGWINTVAIDPTNGDFKYVVEFEDGSLRDCLNGDFWLVPTYAETLKRS